MKKGNTKSQGLLLRAFLHQSVTIQDLLCKSSIYIVVSDWIGIGLPDQKSDISVGFLVALLA